VVLGKVMSDGDGDNAAAAAAIELEKVAEKVVEKESNSYFAWQLSTLSTRFYGQSDHDLTRP
jgi:hypothetical protein